MASSVFFKFKSQKDPQRVAFDGTGITVFELKRSIITLSKLGDGSDFDLFLFRPENNEEYDEDTEVVPRGSTVIASRRPAARPGTGRAARYVFGQAPTASRHIHQKQPTPSMPKPTAEETKEPETEEERIAAMMKAGAEQWELEKQKMKNATPVFRQNYNRPHDDKEKRVPHDNYVCKNCGVKGHFVWDCPTNNNPNFEKKNRRFHKIAGIPSSRLQVLNEKDMSEAEEEAKERGQQLTVMVNSEGQRVVALPDKASWDQYKAKTEASAEKRDQDEEGDREAQERGLACPIDKKLFNDPVKTPCCEKTYCAPCLESALLDSDLKCPGCGSELLLDTATADEAMKSKVNDLEDERLKKKRERAKSGTPPATSHAPSQNNTPKLKKTGETAGNSKKRSADDDADGKNSSEEALEMKKTKSNSPSAPKAQAPSQSNDQFVQQMNALAGTQGFGDPATSQPEQWAFPNGMSMNDMMNMPGMMQNMGAMPNMSDMNAMMSNWGMNGMQGYGMQGPMGPIFDMQGQGNYMQSSGQMQGPQGMSGNGGHQQYNPGRGRGRGGYRRSGRVRG